MTVKPKQATVEAVKLRDTTESKLDLLTIGIMIGEQSGGKLLLTHTMGGATRLVEANYGDYIVLAGGELAVLSDAAFKQLFEIK